MQDQIQNFGVPESQPIRQRHLYQQKRATCEASPGTSQKASVKLEGMWNKNAFTWIISFGRSIVAFCDALASGARWSLFRSMHLQNKFYEVHNYVKNSHKFSSPSSPALRRLFLLGIAGPWAQLGGGHGGRVPPLFQTVRILCAMSPHFFSLGFAIYWFHTDVSPPHFTTKLRPCAGASIYFKD